MLLGSRWLSTRRTRSARPANRFRLNPRRVRCRRQRCEHVVRPAQSGAQVYRPEPRDTAGLLGGAHRHRRAPQPPEVNLTCRRRAEGHLRPTLSQSFWSEPRWRPSGRNRSPGRPSAAEGCLLSASASVVRRVSGRTAGGLRICTSRGKRRGGKRNDRREGECESADRHGGVSCLGWSRRFVRGRMSAVQSLAAAGVGFAQSVTTITGPRG
jgi:hypothetical protein